MIDHYAQLELERGASELELKRAFRRLAKKYHPDRNPAGAEQFKAVVAAYRVLSDERARREYDEAWQREQAPPRARTAAFGGREMGSMPRRSTVSMNAAQRRRGESRRDTSDPHRPIYHRPPLYRPVFRYWSLIAMALFVLVFMPMVAIIGRMLWEAAEMGLAWVWGLFSN